MAMDEERFNRIERVANWIVKMAAAVLSGFQGENFGVADLARGVGAAATAINPNDPRTDVRQIIQDDLDGDGVRDDLDNFPQDPTRS